MKNAQFGDKNSPILILLARLRLLILMGVLGPRVLLFYEVDLRLQVLLELEVL